MKKYINIIFISFLLGCVGPSGKITDNYYSDNTYPVSFSFPQLYKASNLSKSSQTRVTAYSTKYGKITTSVKPLFVISIFKNDKPFADFITSERNNFSDSKLFFNFNVSKETETKIQNFDSHFIYFTSKETTWNTDNSGIITFVNCTNFYIKIEYIAQKGWYSEKEFDYVINSMTVR